MKQKYLLIIICFLIVSKVSFGQSVDIKPAPEGVTAQSVVDKYIIAIGGKDKLSKITGVSIWSKSSIQGNEIIIITHNAVPNKFYMEMGTPDITFQKQIFDGEKGAIIAMGNKTDITGDRLEQLKFDATLFNEMKYAELGATIELIGIAKIDNSDTYVIKVKTKSGPEFFDYYDVNTGYKVMTETKIETPEGKLTMITKFSDYKAVKGIFFPHKIIQEIAAQTIISEVTLITLNKVKDKVFVIE